MEEITVHTKKKIQVLNITSDIKKVKTIRDGFVVLYVPHTTAALVINEDESGLASDLEKFYGRLAEGTWKHNTIDDNAEAHITSTTLNSSLVVPVEKGELILGTWQSILFIELDGPRDRTLYVKELKS